MKDFELFRKEMNTEERQKVLFSEELKHLTDNKNSIISAIDENLLFAEYIDTELKPCINLFLKEKLQERQKDIDDEAYIILRGKQEDEAKKEFTTLFLNSKLDDRYYRHDITETTLYKKAIELKDLYHSVIVNIENGKDYKEEIQLLLSSISITKIQTNKSALSSMINFLINDKGGLVSFLIFLKSKKRDNSFGIFNEVEFRKKINHLNHTLSEKFLNNSKKSLPLQPIGVNESRTKKKIIETITNIDKQGWQYAFASEQDYNLFTDLLTNFFEYKPYTLPETIIQLKRTCKTKVAKALGEIHKELSNENKLSTDTRYFQLIRVLSHFEKETKSDLYKALTR